MHANGRHAWRYDSEFKIQYSYRRVFVVKIQPLMYQLMDGIMVQSQFSLDELKKHPEYAVFAMALDERLRDSETRKRNATMTILGIAVPVMVAIGAGVYGLAQTTITSAVQIAQNEIISELPDHIGSAVDEKVGDDFRGNLKAEIQNSIAASARQSYQLAAAAFQLGQSTMDLTRDRSFSDEQAYRAILALERSIRLGSLDDVDTSQPTLDAAATVAETFALSNRVDLLTRVTSSIGAERALSSDQLANSILISLGRELAGTYKPPADWPQDQRDLFDAATRRLANKPEFSLEWELIIQYRHLTASQDENLRQSLEATISEIVSKSAPGMTGILAVNLLLLTEPLLLTGVVKDHDIRIANLATEFLDQFPKDIADLTKTRQARDEARGIIYNVINANRYGPSASALRSFLQKACDGHGLLCDPPEDNSFSQRVSDVLAAGD